MCRERDAIDERKQAACELSAACMGVLSPEIAATLATAFPAEPFLPPNWIEMLKRLD